MKKNYVSPTAEVFFFSTGHQICIGSPNRANPTEGLDEELENGGDDPGNFSRYRRRNVWDDAEEEEGQEEW